MNPLLLGYLTDDCETITKGSAVGFFPSIITPITNHVRSLEE